MVQYARTPYQIVGVDADYTADDLRRSLRTNGMRLHPDRHPNDPQAEAAFQEYMYAHDILSDADMREAWDLGGYEAFDNSHWRKILERRRRSPLYLMREFMRGAHDFSGMGIVPQDASEIALQGMRVAAQITVGAMHMTDFWMGMMCPYWRLGERQGQPVRAIAASEARFH